jgi:SAM-dependent methyltransferase
MHWHSDYDRIEVASCNRCHSAFTLNASEAIIPYPSTETALLDANFIYLIYHYLELVSGLDWKLPLLDRLPFHRFNSVLEIGCNVGVTLDYCQTAWGTDVLGLEPSAYGAKGAELLDLPIFNAYSHEAQELNDRGFSLVYCTEVLEHAPNPLAFLKELHTYLEPGGILLITTPCSSALHKDTPPGALYAVLSPGAHYFVLSQKQLRQLALEAGFKHVGVELVHQTNIAYMSDRPITFQADPPLESKLARYYEEKITGKLTDDYRLYLGHLISYYIAASKSNTLQDECGISDEIEKGLTRHFSFSLDDPMALASRIVTLQSIFDLGKTIPYSLPTYLYHRAGYLNSMGKDTGHYYELAALISAKGLQIDFQNLFLYSDTFRLSQQRMQTISTRSQRAKQTSQKLRHMIDEIIASVSELNTDPLTIHSRVKRKLRSIYNKLLNFM